jgi:large subunit ribosomal protein L21
MAKELKEVKENNKYAVIALAGTQLKVFEGKEYEVNKLEGDKGDKISVSEVLLVVDGEDVKVGNPFVEGSKVELEIKSQKKDTKIDVFKFKSKSRYRRSYGHRSLITRVAVKKIA